MIFDVRCRNLHTQALPWSLQLTVYPLQMFHGLICTLHTAITHVIIALEQRSTRWMMTTSVCVLFLLFQYESVLTVSQAMDVYFTRLKYVKHRPRVPFKGNIKLWWVVPFWTTLLIVASIAAKWGHFCFFLFFPLFFLHNSSVPSKNLSVTSLILPFPTICSSINMLYRSLSSARWKFAYNSILDEQVKPKLETWSWKHMKAHRCVHTGWCGSAHAT